MFRKILGVDVEVRPTEVGYAIVLDGTVLGYREDDYERVAACAEDLRWRLNKQQRGIWPKQMREIYA